MKPTAWYDPTNGMVSTDKDSPLFTPLGQVWPLYLKQEVALRNNVLEEVAIEFEKMKVFEADTMASIAVNIRNMKR
jgi:hypothetical protein